MSPSLGWTPAVVLVVGAVLATAGVKVQRALPLRVPLAAAVPETLEGFRGRDLPMSDEEAQAASVGRTVERLRPKVDEYSQETVEFRMGQIVTHKIYGRGRIVQISGFGDDLKLSVVFNDGTRKKLMAKFANFEGG